MLDRIRKAQDDEGFTLIELLVVIMIIGILSAIAVPTFLGQRTKGYEKAAMSELASMAIAQESVRTEGGAYLALNDASLPTNGYAHTAEVTIEGTIATGGAGYVICARHTSGGDKFVIRHTAASPTRLAGGPTAACPTS